MRYAETTPPRASEHYQYDFNLRDIAEVWRRGSVVASWLLDLTAAALVDDVDLKKFSGRVQGRALVLADRSSASGKEGTTCA